MERKENDLMLNITANPTFTLLDFATVGLNIDNTSLQDKDLYRNHPIIQERFTDEKGKFNDFEFTNTYNKALVNFNEMANDDYDKSVNDFITYHRDNIFAPVSLRRKGPEIMLIETPNPDRLTSSLIRLGEVGPRTKSLSELAQSEKVLLNPLEVELGKDPIWGEAPEDNFWGYFDDTLVLAQYDKDIINQETGEIEHHKGDLKIGPNGTYYYETLDGRNSYRRRILNKMDVFTKEGSWWNQYDFFDSDDINQKNPIGSLMKNLVLVGSMFIPYVGPVVTGLSLATLLAGLMGTLGKMASSSDIPFFNELEGWSKSVSRMGHTTEYAQNNMWCWENMINLAGDVAGLLKEQRFIFEKIPSIFTGKYIGNDKSMKKLEQAFKTLHNQKADDVISKLPQKNLARIQAERVKATLRALADMDSFVKNYNKIGAVLGKGYMTALVTLDTYNEAINAGATDLEAIMLTLGYAAAEYALLSSDIGSWIMPELRDSKLRNKAILKAITRLDEGALTSSRLKGAAFKRLDLESKKHYIKRVFKLGKQAAEEAHVAYTSTGKGFLKASLSAGLAEGLEETSEELLADFSKGCYNVVKWLQDGDTRLSTFGFQWTDGERSWNGKDLVDRYGMSFVGGYVGGGFANLGNNYRTSKSYANMTSKQAMEQLVYIGRNEGFKLFRRDLAKFDLPIANKNLSPEVIESNGMLINPPGTKLHNQDLFVRDAVNKQLDIIENLLNANGAVSDEEFLDIQTLRDLRYSLLRESVTAGRYLQRFNSLYSNIILTTNSINNIVLQSTDNNENGKVEDFEIRYLNLSDSEKQEVDRLKKELELYQNEIKDLTEGKLTDLFISDAMFEMNTYLLDTLGFITLPMYVKKKLGKKISELSEEELLKVSEEFKNYKTDNWDDIASASKIFRDIVQTASDTIKQNETEYVSLSELKFRNTLDSLLQTITLLSEDALEYLENIKDYESYGQLLYNNPEFAENLYNLTRSAILESVEQGGLNFEVKTSLNKILNHLQSYYLNLLLLYLDDPVNIFNSDSTPYDENVQELISLKNLLEQIGNTPIFKSLNEFSLSLGKDEINIQQILLTSERLLLEKISSLQEFNLEQFEVEIENALKTLRIYKAAILAARTDAANITNIFGYNATLNEVSRKVGKDTNLAEIDSNYADLLNSDIDLLEHKLEVVLNLHRINQHQKLYKQDRVATNTSLRLYNKIRFIVNIPDDHPLKTWDGYKEFEAIIKAQSKLEEYSNLTQNVSLSSEEQSLLELERISVEDAIYDFFNANLDKLNNPELLASIIGIYDLYTNSNELLTEDLSDLDGPSFIWYLASRAAVKSSAFHSELNSILDPNSGIASIFPQELAIYNNYASIINGDIFTKFFNAYRISLKKNWKNKSIEQRRAILKELDVDDVYASDEWSDYVFNIIPSPKFSNITLTEGIPGSGKTQSVFKFTIDLLNKYHQEFLRDVLITHGADENVTDNKGNRIPPEQGTQLQQNLGINGNVLTIQELLKRITVNYKPYVSENGRLSFNDGDFYFNQDNDIISSLEISVQNIPSLIIIDEVTKLSDLELTIIDKFARKNGITVIVAGDYDQIGVQGTATIKVNNKETQINIASERNKFARVPKLGVSMRVDNSLKARNLAIFLNLVKSKGFERVGLWYDEDETGLYGDKVINSKYYIEVILSEVDKFIKTLQPEEKIGFIYFDKNSSIYEALNKSPYKQYLKFMEGGTALGSEGRYYIIDTPSDVTHVEQVTDYWKLSIYTGLTRARQGSLIITQGIDLLVSDKSTRTESNLSKRAIELYNIRRKQRLLNVKDERTRASRRTSETNPIINQNEELDEVVNNEESDVENVEKDDISIDNSNEVSEIRETDITDSLDHIMPGIEVNNETGLNYLNNLNDKLINQFETVRRAFVIRLLQLYKEYKRKYPNDLDELENYLEESIDKVDLLLSKALDDLYVSLSTYRTTITEANNDPNIIKHAIYSFDKSVEIIKNTLNNAYLGIYEDNNSFIKEFESIINLDISIDDGVVYDNTSISNLLEEELLNESISQQELPELNNTQNSGSIMLEMWLHSFNTYELGVVFDKDGKNFTYNPKRIDSVNGLIKIRKYLESIGTSSDVLDTVINENFDKKLCEKIIGRLRSILFNTKDKSELILKLEKVLKMNGIFVNFAIKNHYISNKLYSSDNIFLINPEEEISQIDSLGSNKSKVNNRKIVALIGNLQTGEILEIPLLTFTSPFTLALTTKNGLYVYPKLVNFLEHAQVIINGNVYEGYIENGKLREGINKYKLLKDLLEICKNDPLYKNMYNWIELYLYSYGAIFRITDPKNSNDNWTIAKNLVNSGSHINITAGLNYDDNAELTTNYDIVNEENWVNVSSLRDNPSVSVTSKVYKSKTGLYNDIKVCNPGHNFVLVSHDLSLNNDRALINLYLAQCKDPSLDKKVSLYYVLPPRVLFREYIENLNRLLYTPNVSSTYSPLHSVFASYKILSILLKSELFKSIFNLVFPSSEGNASLLEIIDPIVNELDLIENSHDKAAKLMEKISFGKNTKEVPLTTHFNQILTSLVYGKDLPSSLLEENPSVLNEERVNLIESILNDKLFKLYYNIQIDYNEDSINGFYPVFLEENYKVSGKPFKIHGKIDSYTFVGDMSNLFEHVVSDVITVSETGFKSSKDSYLLGGKKYKEYVSPNLSEYSKKLNEIQDKLIKIFPNLKKYNISDNLSELEFNSILLKISEDINHNVKTYNKFALVIDNLLVITDDHILFNCDSVRFDTLQNMLYVIHSDNVLEPYADQYHVSYENGKIILTPDLNVQQETNNEQILITSENFDTFKQVGKEVFGKGFKGLLAFKKLFEANSFEEFEELLKYLKPDISGKRINSLTSILNSDISSEATLLVNYLILLDKTLSQELDNNTLCPIPITIGTIII